MNGEKHIAMRPAVVFITGLSGSGKTTLAKAAVGRLAELGIDAVLLDGDEIRNIVGAQGFDEESRKRHNLYVGYMASLLEAAGKIVFVSLISPFTETRDRIRKMCNHFLEVYLSTDLDTCIKRDPKGLYSKALKGEIKDFTGISSPYFPPLNPELVIDTGVINARESLKKILDLLYII